MISSHLWEEKRGFISTMGRSAKQSCLCDEASIQTLDLEALMGFPGWQYSVHVVSHVSKRVMPPKTAWGEDKSFMFVPSPDSAMSLPWGGSHLILCLE